MDLAARKYRFIQQLERVDENLLDKLEKLVGIDAKEKDWFFDLSDDEKSEIEIGLRESDRDDLQDHESVMKAFNKWR